MKNNKTLAFLALVFVALFSYWTFEQVKYQLNKNKSFEQLPDTSSTSTQKLEDNKETKKEDTTNNENQENKGTAQETTSYAKWKANDYKKGDITDKTYTVKYGDTLWEIAEGVYGDGTLWVNILQANSSSIGFLPNGQQALIFPGQVLQIP